MYKGPDPAVKMEIPGQVANVNRSISRHVSRWPTCSPKTSANS